MQAKLILTITLFGIAGLALAADDNAAKPQSGSATTKEQSAAHPATDGAEATKDKAGAETELSTNHPAAKGDADSQAATSPAGDANSKRSGAGGVRDWAVIDTDRDSLISPDEMQKFLDQAWANKKSN